MASFGGLVPGSSMAARRVVAIVDLLCSVVTDGTVAQASRCRGAVARGGVGSAGAEDADPGCDYRFWNDPTIVRC